jgi:predicted lactoylglutathione lyase
MKIRTTILCLPVRDLEKTFAFYKNALGFSDAQIDEGIIALELPNLSLFLMEKNVFETYSKKAGREAQFPNSYAGLAISCAMETKEEVDAILESVPKYGGAVPTKAAMDEISGGYTGYFSDPDGYLWELVFPQPKQRNEGTSTPK